MHAPTSALQRPLWPAAPMPPLMTLPPVRVPQVAAAGALAISGDATISLQGTGGGASNNMLSVAGFAGTWGGAYYSGDVSTVPASDNLALGTALPLIEEPIVASIVNTVMDAGGPLQLLLPPRYQLPPPLPGTGA